jgi:hypothetical protein
MGIQGRGVNGLTGHLEAQSWAADMARSGGDLRRHDRVQRCRRGEVLDMWGPNVSERRERRPLAWKAQTK